MEHNRALARAAHDHLATTLGVAPLVPAELIGSLAVVSLPDSSETAQSGYDPGDPIYRRLLSERIEVPVFAFPKAPKRLIRISTQIYNSRADYERLGNALLGALASDN
jgi:isopenicillin-N epimerase